MARLVESDAGTFHAVNRDTGRSMLRMIPEDAFTPEEVAYYFAHPEEMPLVAYYKKTGATHAQQIVTTTDTFGSGPNTFTMDFVTVGSPGNTNNAGPNGGPYGGVDYVYRISTYEISQNDIPAATAAGLTNVTAGAWAEDQPAANISWYEAAAFVNWLNQEHYNDPKFKAYNLTLNPEWTMTLWSSENAWQLGGENLYRHKDAYYFLPSDFG